MKYVKMLGLAAMAAMALTAFLGVSSASAADRLCETSASPCTSPVANTGTINGVATNATLTGSTHINCATSAVTVKMSSNNGAAAPTGTVNALSWNTCRDNTHGVNCEINTQGLPYHAEITTPTAGVPNLTVKTGNGGGNPRALAVCAGFINCTFTNSDFTLPIDTGATASVTAVGIKLTSSGFLCPSEAFWDAKYVAQAPTASLFVTNS